MKVNKVNMLLGGVVWALFVGNVTSWAGTVIIPNTYVSGQIATASSVNENFNAIKLAVNDNANQIAINANNIAIKKVGIVKDSNEKTIGTFLGIDDFGIITIVSSKGYMFRLHQDGNIYWRPSSVEYDSADCMGNPYLDTAQSVDWNGSNYLYVPKGRSATYVKTYSYKYYAYSTCSNYGVGNFHYKYLAEPNDPNITGVPNSSVSMPVTIEFQ